MENWEHMLLVEKLESEIDEHLKKVKKSVEHWYLSPEWAVREKIKEGLSCIRFVCLMEYYMQVIKNNREFGYGWENICK